VLRLAAPFPDQGNVADLLGLLFTGAFREGALWESPPASGDGGGRWELVGAEGRMSGCGRVAVRAAQLEGCSRLLGFVTK